MTSRIDDVPARASFQRQFAWLLASRLLGGGMQAATLIFLARAVPVAEFGAVSLVIAAGTVFFAFSDLGLSNFVPKMRAQRIDEAVRAALRLNIESTALFGALAVVAAATWLHVAGFDVWAAAVAGSLALEKNVDCMLSVAVADGKQRVMAASVLLRRGTTFGLFAAAVLLDEAGVAAYAVAAVVGALIGQGHAWLTNGERAAPERIDRWALLREAWPFLVSNLTGQVRMLDTVVINGLLATSAAGLYAAATRICQPLTLIPATITTLLLPHSARLAAADARRAAWRVAALAGSLSVVMSPLLMVSTEIMIWLFGPAYGAAGSVFGWTAVFLPIVSSVSPLSAILQGQENERFASRVGLAFFPISVAGMIFGATLWGIVGVAVALGVSYLIRSVVLLFRCARLVPDGVPRRGSRYISKKEDDGYENG
jgi:O-antigen/teichoic acid export membrane protein